MSQLKNHQAIEFWKTNEIWGQMLDSSGCVIYVLNLETREVEYKNRSIHIDLGYRQDELERPDAVIPQQLLHPDDLINVDDFFAILRQSKTFRKILRLKNKDGHWSYYNLTFKPYHNNKLHRAVGTLSDVTQLKKSQLIFIEQKKEAERLATAKSDFLARMSHEIRTPLTSIIAIAENLVADLRHTLNQQFAESLLSSAQHLHEVVNEILDLSKIESGKLEMHKEAVDFKAFVQTLMSHCQSQAKKDGTQLSLDLLQNIPDYVALDLFRMRQILLNIISNALKFAKGRNVRLSVAVNGGYLDMQIQDNGCGIPTDQLAHIFDCYRQAAGTVGGTGLGLTITKSIVQAMGGEIRISSIVAKGTTVNLLIPIEVAQKPKPQISEIFDRGRDNKILRGQKIMVIDDNRINLDVVSLLVRRAGGQALLVDNPAQINFAVTKDCDLVLIDYRMPGMSGVELAKKMRSKGITKPILAFTADCSSEVLRDCKKAGMNEVLLKPFRSKEFIATLASWINKSIHNLEEKAS